MAETDLQPIQAQDDDRLGKGSTSLSKPSWFKGSLPDSVAFLVVLSAAVVVAVLMFASYYGAPDLLWREFYHDRNSHYGFGLDLALAARNLDPAWFLTELENAKVWPPFHGLVLSAVLLLGGIDYRLGVVPSLIGWTVTIAFVWLIARRLFTDRISGWLAAAIAVILTAASPTFQLVSTDVMLEGLGAGLSAAGLWAYLRAFEMPENVRRWRLLAVILTVLFFHKGNYWGLLIAPLAIAFATEHWQGTMGLLRTAAARFDGGAAIKAAISQPLLILATLVLLLVWYLYARGPTALVLFGRSVSLYPPENLTTIAYALIFIWWTGIWWRHKAAIEQAIGTAGRALLYWHVTPIAVSFLLPHRLSRFLWFVGPANTADANYSLWQGVGLYWTAFADGFHVAPWLAIPAVGLTAIGAVGIGRLTPGARVVFLFALLAWVGVVVHPQHQARFMSTWVFAVWICSGAGAGVLLGLLQNRLSPLIRGLVAAAVTAAALVVNVGHPTPAGAYAFAIQVRDGPSDLNLVRPYLAELDGAREVAVFTTFGTSRLFAWAIRERCRCYRRVDAPVIANFTSREQVREVMAERIAQSTADVIVTIDAAHIRYEFPMLGWVYPKMAGILDAMAAQDRYARASSYELPVGDAVATIWRRR